MKEITVYQTSDNMTFPNQAEAQQHERLLADEQEIRAFIDASDLTKATATRAKNVIRNFLSWRANGELPPKPEED